MIESTIDAIRILDATYAALCADKDTVYPVRAIVMRATDRLNRELKRMLTGE